jgi:hypothetical protein
MNVQEEKNNNNKKRINIKGECDLDSSDSGQAPGTSSCGNGNEPSGSIKDRE